MTSEKRIETLEVLRSIAFIGVLWSHCGFEFLRNTGSWAVSVFLILSGFVSVISYKNNNTKLSIKETIKYSINRIKKLYLLYVISTLALIVFDCVGEKTLPLKIMLLKIISNLLLIQEWIPINNRSFNSPAWFLCTLFFSYFIFPFFYKKMEKRITKKVATISIAALYIVQILLCYSSNYIPQPSYNINSIFIYNIKRWIIYYFPITRIIEILIGYYLGFIYINNRNKVINNVTFKEILFALIALLSICISSSFYISRSLYQEIETINPNDWWRETLIFTPSSVVLVYLGAYGQGKISKVIVNKISLYLAKISSYGFLIHNVIFTYIKVILWHVFGEEVYFYYGAFAKFVFGIPLTIICCEIWRRQIMKKYTKYSIN